MKCVNASIEPMCGNNATIQHGEVMNTKGLWVPAMFCESCDETLKSNLRKRNNYENTGATESGVMR